jgi:hypothetical protein
LGKEIHSITIVGDCGKQNPKFKGHDAWAATKSMMPFLKCLLPALHYKYQNMALRSIVTGVIPGLGMVIDP